MNSANPGKFQPGLVGGVALGVGMSVFGLVSAIAPILGCLSCAACCTLPPGAGFLASFLYLKNVAPSAEKPFGDGALLGLLAGAVGAVVGTILSIPISFLQSSLGLAPDMDEFMDQLRDQGGGELPPEFFEFMEKFMPSAEGLSVVGLIFGFFVSLLVYSILSLIGGIVGIAVLHKEAPAGSTTYTPPPPPAA